MEEIIMAGARGKTLEEKSENTTLSEEDEKICRKSAEQMLGWTQCPPHSISSVTSRMSGFLDKKIECKQLVRKYITESSENQDLKNAALIHFDFVDKLPSTEEVATAADFNRFLLEAMSDPRLTLEYANNLYLSCHKDTWHILESNKNRYKISIWAMPEKKSQQWQEVVEKIHTIALNKLDREERGLTVSEQIALLERAKTMPIFNEHASNVHVGQTRPVSQIDLVLNKLKQTQPENYAPKLGI
jgi:hypothetical protein